jgi:hypothetical protein
VLPALRSRYDDAVIAWGGVVTQAVVAVPLVTFVAIFGFTRSDPVNVAIGILGYYSLIVAGFTIWFQSDRSTVPRRGT